MADEITLEVEARETTGKKVKHLRKDGKVPAVIHDHGKESIVIQGDYTAMHKAYQQAGKHTPIELKHGTQSYTALIKSASFEPRKARLSHIVFNAVDKNQKVEAEVPLHLAGEIPAEKAGLLVLAQLTSVMVEAVPSKLPDQLEIDATDLNEVGDKLSLADLKIPEGVTLITEPEHVVATVFEPSALAAANEAAGGDAEPEEASEVPSEHESTAEEGTQEDEQRPGGKKEFEDKSQGHNPEKQ